MPPKPNFGRSLLVRIPTKRRTMLPLRLLPPHPPSPLPRAKLVPNPQIISQRTTSQLVEKLTSPRLETTPHRPTVHSHPLTTLHRISTMATLQQTATLPRNH